jgi:hypothetical protein
LPFFSTHLSPSSFTCKSFFEKTNISRSYFLYRIISHFIKWLVYFQILSGGKTAVRTWNCSLNNQILKCFKNNFIIYFLCLYIYTTSSFKLLQHVVESQNFRQFFQSMMLSCVCAFIKLHSLRISKHWKQQLESHVMKVRKRVKIEFSDRAKSELTKCEQEWNLIWL